MYRHFLVPIDHADDTVDLVVHAVHLAASLKARVTFLHTGQQHPSAANPSELRADPDAPRGIAREVLAKAEAAARAWGVPCHTMATEAGSTAAAAISAAARAQGCDLILAAASGAQRHATAAAAGAPIHVLPQFDLPVLITPATTAASSLPAIRALREEHRMLAAVLQAWGLALEAGDASPVSRMQSMLAFIGRLEAEHHPKERALFLRLRERTSTVDADLDEICRQHDREGAMRADLAARVQAMQTGLDAAARLEARRALAAALSDYTRLIWDHLGRKEAVVLPAAMRHLQEADWAALEQVFSPSDAQARTLARSGLLQDILNGVQDFTAPMPGCDGGSHAA